MAKEPTGEAMSRYPQQSFAEMISRIKDPALTEEQRARALVAQHHQFILYSPILELSMNERNRLSAAMDTYADAVIKAKGNLPKDSQAEKEMLEVFANMKPESGLQNIGTNIARAIHNAWPRDKVLS